MLEEKKNQEDLPVHISATQLEHIRELCQRFRVAKLYLFGSVLTEGFRPDSDIDLLVDFEEMEVLDFADNYFGLLEQLSLNLDREIDLVIEKDLSNPVLIESIQQSRQLIYEKENTKVAV